MNKGNTILLVLSIIFIAGGAFIYFEASKFQKSATVTDGSVVYALGSSFKISYTSEDGNEHIKQGSSGKTKRYHDGEKVTVWYQSEDPARARLSDGMKGGKKVMIYAAGFLLLSLYMTWTERRKNRAEI
jgi:hypothetical protein